MRVTEKLQDKFNLYSVNDVKRKIGEFMVDEKGELKHLSSFCVNAGLCTIVIPLGLLANLNTAMITAALATSWLSTTCYPDSAGTYQKWRNLPKTNL